MLGAVKTGTQAYHQLTKSSFHLARNLCNILPPLLSTHNRGAAGDVAVDNHLAPSTLAGEHAQKVNQFRQLRLREYMDVCQLCRERNVPLSEALLKKGQRSF